jgi:hypothetical protein
MCSTPRTVVLAPRGPVKPFRAVWELQNGRLLHWAAVATTSVGASNGRVDVRRAAPQARALVATVDHEEQMFLLGGTHIEERIAGNSFQPVPRWLVIGVSRWVVCRESRRVRAVQTSRFGRRRFELACRRCLRASRHHRRHSQRRHGEPPRVPSHNCSSGGRSWPPWSPAWPPCGEAGLHA